MFFVVFLAFIIVVDVKKVFSEDLLKDKWIVVVCIYFGGDILF